MKFLAFISKLLKDLVKKILSAAIMIGYSMVNYIGHDLGPNCLQKLSEDDTSINRVKV